MAAWVVVRLWVFVVSVGAGLWVHSCVDEEHVARVPYIYIYIYIYIVGDRAWKLWVVMIPLRFHDEIIQVGSLTTGAHLILKLTLISIKLSSKAITPHGLEIMAMRPLFMYRK